MELAVHGKHLDVGDALRTHIKDKLTDIDEKYFNRAIDAVVTLSPAPHGFFRTHISMRGGKDIMVQATATEGEPYASFDAAAEKIAKQLRRYKKRLRDHHERLEQDPEEAFTVRDYVIEAEAEDHVEEAVNDDLPQGEDPVIVAEMTRPVQSMSVRDAVMRMDLAGESALLFRNSKTNTLNMVYKRSDGNVGWVDPEATKLAAAE